MGIYKSTTIFSLLLFLFYLGFFSSTLKFSTGFTERSLQYKNTTEKMNVCDEEELIEMEWFHIWMIYIAKVRALKRDPII